MSNQIKEDINSSRIVEVRYPNTQGFKDQVVFTANPSFRDTAGPVYTNCRFSSSLKEVQVREVSSTVYSKTTIYEWYIEIKTNDRSIITVPERLCIISYK